MNTTSSRANWRHQSIAPKNANGRHTDGARSQIQPAQDAARLITSKNLRKKGLSEQSGISAQTYALQRTKETQGFMTEIKTLTTENEKRKTAIRYVNTRLLAAVLMAYEG